MGYAKGLAAFHLLIILTISPPLWTALSAEKKLKEAMRLSTLVSNKRRNGQSYTGKGYGYGLAAVRKASC